MNSRFHFKPYQGSPNRKNPRVTTNLAGHYEIGGNWVKTNITTLSSGGVSFQAKSILDPGETIQVSFTLGDELFSYQAEVTRTDSNDYGCKFLDISPEEMERLNKIITQVFFSGDGGRSL